MVDLCQIAGEVFSGHVFDQLVVKSARNIPGCMVAFANVINVYDILNAKKLVIDQTAVAKIEEVFA